LSITRVKASSITQGLPKGKTALTGNSVILPGSYESIATVTVGAGGAANVEFTSISGTYKHLQIRGIARDTGSASLRQVYIQFNSDTSTNYSWHELEGNGSAAGSYGGTTTNKMWSFYYSTASQTASAFGTAVIDILDYSNTNKYKTIRTLGGADLNGSGTISLSSANWRNTNAVTSIKLLAEQTAFAQHSTFALYGIK